MKLAFDPMLMVALAAVLSLAVLLLMTRIVLKRARPRGERFLILGTGPLARELVREIGKTSYPGAVVGIVAESGSPETALHGVPVLGDVNALHHIIRDLEPDRIVVALAERRHRLPVHQLVEARVSGRVVVEDGEDAYERITGKLSIESLRPSSVIFSNDFRPSEAQLAASRLMSLGASLFGLVALAPVFLLVAAAIKLDSRGPVLFVQERIGLGGRKFRLLKFRTMRPAENRRSEWVRDNGDRITRIGKWLRRFRLDELPQFVNILKGDMNLVGPRPHPASNFEMFALVSRNTPHCGEQIPYYSLRSIVRPGITGWAQVRYQYANDLNEEIEKMRYDLFYVKHFSFGLDLKILIDTVKIVLHGHEYSGSDTQSPERARDAAPGREDQSPVQAAPTLVQPVLSRAYGPGGGRKNERLAIKGAGQP